MKKAIRNILTILALAAFVALSALIYAGARKERALHTCKDIRVEYADQLRFVSLEDVKGYLAKHYGAYVGQRLDSIRLDKVEKILDSQSAILKSEAYTTDDGMLNIVLTQREPVVRFQKGDKGFYADAGGFIFPLQDNFTTLVPVVDGNIPIDCPAGYKGAPRTEKEQAWMSGVLYMLAQMEKSKVWAENIVQIHVDEKGDIILVPRSGNETFIFGSPFGAAGKLERLGKYYRYILPAKGEGFYRTVNLKYDNQIVCKQ